MSVANKPLDKLSVSGTIRVMKRIITSILIMAGGIVILLANINVEPVREVAGVWWPIVFIVIAGLSLWGNRQNWAWPLILTIFGVALLLSNLGINKIEFGDIVLPAILLAIGLSMLLKSRPSESTATTQGEDIVTILGGTTNKNTAKNYTGSKATAILGGVELDLSKVKIEKTAQLDVFVLMGGIELRIPEDVIVKNRSTAIMGGLEDKTNPVESKNAPVLYIDGTVIMGGIDIKR